VNPLFLAAILSIPLIALANITWGILLFCTLAVRRSWKMDPPFVALIAYVMASVASIATSAHPIESLHASKDLLNFLVFPLSAIYAREMGQRALMWVFVFMGIALAAWGFLQYAFVVPGQPFWRIRGPLSHYMTFAGLLVILILINTVTALKEKDRILRWAAMAGIILPIVAVILSLTRNAWVGLAAGFLVIVVSMRRKAALVILILFIVVLFLPGPHRDRVRSLFDLSDPSNNDRLAMMVAGTRMFLDHPLTGVGPDMARKVYPFYREPWSTRLRIPHLHNNVIQIAAERGLAGLLPYGFFLGTVIFLGWRRRRTWGGLASIASLVGITLAGLFEWNFGDTEVLMLTLVASTLYLVSDEDSGTASDKSSETQPVGLLVIGAIRDK